MACTAAGSCMHCMHNALMAACLKHTVCPNQSSLSSQGCVFKSWPPLPGATSMEAFAHTGACLCCCCNGRACVCSWSRMAIMVWASSASGGSRPQGLLDLLRALCHPQVGRGCSTALCWHHPHPRLAARACGLLSHLHCCTTGGTPGPVWLLQVHLTWPGSLREALSSQRPALLTHVGA